MEESPHKDLIIKQSRLHQDNGDDERAHFTFPAVTSPVIQDSPFSDFASNLSPIEQVKSIRVAQGFGDLSLLPPPTVFTSPHDVSRAETISSRRKTHGVSSGLKSLSAKRGSEDDTPNSNNFGQRKVGSLIRYFEMIPCSGKESLGQDSLHFSTLSPSACVGDYLADSSDGCQKNGDSPPSCSEPAHEPPQMQGRNSSSGCETTPRHEIYVSVGKGKNHSPAMLEVPKGVHVPAVESVGLQVEVIQNDLRKKSDLVVQENDDTDTDWPDFLVEDDDVFETRESLHPEPTLSTIQNSEHVYDRITADLSPKVSTGQEGRSFVKKSKLVTFSNCHENDDKVVIIQHTDSVPQNEWNTSQLSLDSIAASGHDTPSGKLSTSGNDMVVDKMIVMAEGVQHQHDLPSVLAPDYQTPLLCEKRGKSVQMSENSSRACIKPLGIGLHLNSIGSKTKENINQKPFLGNENIMSQIENSTPMMGKHISHDQYQGYENDNRPSAEKFTCSDSPITCHFAEHIDMDQEAPGAVTPEPCFHVLLLDAVGMDSCTNSENFCSDLTPIGHETPASVVACISQEEINQLNSKKRKKSVTDTTEGCKRCKCKKSKCLKLYCDCFAAGTYCMGSCTCQGCLNRLEFKDKVIAARQLIESRNPLAFAPRVVWRIVDAPLNGSIGDDSQTPTSARHKRGCSCKRSKCLKKYCECHQAGVVCSDGCRCQSCKNIFGQKEVCLRIKYAPAADIGWEKQSENNVALVKADRNPSERCHPTNLTPVTPLLQYSRHESIVPNPQLAARKRPASPGSEALNHPSTSGMPRRSQRLVADNCRSSKHTQENSDTDDYKQRQSELKASKASSHPSPSRGRSMELHPATPSSYLSSVAVAESADTDKILGVQPHHKGVGPSRLFDQRNCPSTPMPRIGNEKMLEVDDYVATPEILRSTSSPIKVVKAGSPNQKRVSPPHLCNIDTPPGRSVPSDSGATPTPTRCQVRHFQNRHGPDTGQRVGGILVNILGAVNAPKSIFVQVLGRKKKQKPSFEISVSVSVVLNQKRVASPSPRRCSPFAVRRRSPLVAVRRSQLPPLAAAAANEGPRLGKSFYHFHRPPKQPEIRSAIRAAVPSAHSLL